MKESFGSPPSDSSLFSLLPIVSFLVLVLFKAFKYGNVHCPFLILIDCALFKPVKSSTRAGRTGKLEKHDGSIKLLFYTALFVAIIAELVGSESVFRLINWGSADMAFVFIVWCGIK
jgi:hypothetical protein